jgi:RNA polymerase sigma-70 factor (ECF subfamily)
MKRRDSSTSAEPPAEPGGVAELYRRYAAWLKRAMSRRFGAEQAEDLVQEAYLRIILAKTDLEIRHPRALLMRVAVNAAIDDRRRVQARGGGKTSALDDHGLEGFALAPAHQAEALLLKQVILALPTDLRDVFVLSRFSGLTYEEIGQLQGISVKTVEWRMSKALAQCGRALSMGNAGSKSP